MGATTSTARASSPNKVSLFKEAAIKSPHVIPAFLLLPLAFTTSPKPMHSRQLSKGIEGSSSLKNLEPVVIWMKCRQQENRDREGGESSILETEETRGIDSFSLFLFLKAISPFTNNICLIDVFKQLDPMASEQSITYLQTDLAYSRSHIIERVQLQINSQFSEKKLPFSCSVMSDSLRPHGLQHTRSPCPSPSPSLHKLMFC